MRRRIEAIDARNQGLAAKILAGQVGRARRSSQIVVGRRNVELSLCGRRITDVNLATGHGAWRKPGHRVARADSQISVDHGGTGVSHGRATQNGVALGRAEGWRRECLERRSVGHTRIDNKREEQRNLARDGSEMTTSPGKYQAQIGHLNLLIYWISLDGTSSRDKILSSNPIIK